MQDFYYAGGLPALMMQMNELLDLDAGCVTGKSIGSEIASAEVWNDDVIRPLENPVYPQGALAVLKGNLAPDGCVIKPSACAAKFLKHSGPPLVFDSYAQMKADIDAPDLAVDENTVLIMRGAGPVGGPGMPEWGMLPIPQKLLKAGVRDMIRISDARMSGTSYGACILHVAPEAHLGGPLALVQTGDMIEIDVDARRINMHVSKTELADRRAAWRKPEPKFERGYGVMFSKHVLQANEGCDFDYLETGYGAPVPEPEIL